MRITILFFLILVFQMTGYSQVGLSVGYSLNQQAEDWNSNALNGENVKANGLYIGLDYWFRLKNYRVEFLPEIGYQSGSHTITMNELGQTDLGYSQISLLLNTSVYPFDFEGDCNCPTFGKDGNFFQKGFYLQIAPGVAQMSTSTRSTSSEIESDHSSTVLLLAVGAGLDIGITDYITLTPFVRYWAGWNAEWQDLTLDPNESSIVSTRTGDVTLGLRTTYRLDYKRNRF